MDSRNVSSLIELLRPLTRQELSLEDWGKVFEAAGKCVTTVVYRMPARKIGDFPLVAKPDNPAMTLHDEGADLTVTGDRGCSLETYGLWFSAVVRPRVPTRSQEEGVEGTRIKYVWGIDAAGQWLLVTVQLKEKSVGRIWYEVTTGVTINVVTPHTLMQTLGEFIDPAELHFAMRKVFAAWMEPLRDLFHAAEQVESGLIAQRQAISTVPREKKGV